jgi:hypothetical protein
VDEYKQFFQRALDEYCAREADRAEHYRKWRYSAEVVLIQSASEHAELLLELHIPLNDWTVRLYGSPSFPRKMASSSWGCAQTRIDAERDLWLWFFPQRIGLNTGKSSKLIGVRQYEYENKHFMFARPIVGTADIGELLALPAEFLEAAQFVLSKYPRQHRPIAFHQLRERNLA